jgi:putative DNA-invertase from lambdoid prophage Rac
VRFRQVNKQVIIWGCMSSEKWALYARASTKDKQNPEIQMKELRDYADRLGYDCDEYVETISTRKTRPMKEMVLQKLRKREYAGVIVWKLDRWGRSTAELVMELTEFHERGIKFISLSDSIDMTTASGRAFVGFLSVFAQFERDLTQERVLIGLEGAKARGKTLGRPKGSKDTKDRRKSGYYLRYSNKK